MPSSESFVTFIYIYLIETNPNLKVTTFSSRPCSILHIIGVPSMGNNNGGKSNYQP